MTEVTEETQSTEPEGWDLLVDRADVRRTRLVPAAVPTAEEGRLVLRTSLASVTANTTAYAELGDELRYWDFFPAPDHPGWGKVPMWGFADVVASGVPEVAPGTRVYGYVPSASHLLVTPELKGDSRFRDVAGMRGELPASYSNYLRTDRDEAYHPADREDLQALFRPLFITSFALDDWLGESAGTGADTVLLSSASSKTAYGTALLLSRRADRPRLVGLTSPGNLEYTSGLGCYDEVLTYDAVGDLVGDGPVLYLDFAGSASVRKAVRARLGSQLVGDVVVGLTHHEGISSSPDGATDGPQPEFWFAPDHLRRRGREWGPGGFHRLFGEAWRSAVPQLADWVRVETGTGPQALASAWSQVLDGRTAPGTGHVVRL